jgi:putative peptidoglycan lipid II flippase
MLQRLWLLERQFSVGKATLIIGSAAILSRLLGLVRDQLLASRFGAGAELDVYYASFRIPDFIFNLLILGTLSVAFIPVYGEYLAKDKERANRIANTVLMVAAFVIATLCLLGFLFAEPLTHLIAPGFNTEQFRLATQIVRIMIWTPFLFTISSILTSILHSHKQFLVAGFAPLFYNLGIIASIIFLTPVFGLYGLAYGVVLGALLHLLIQIPASIHTHFELAPLVDLKDAAIKKIGKLFLPRIFGLDISQISQLVAAIIGSQLASGNISLYSFAVNLQAVPLGLIGISTATAVFPLLTEKFAQGDNQGYIDSLLAGLRQVLFYITPLAIGLFVLRVPIIQLIYQRGAFTEADTLAAAGAIAMFCLSIPFQGILPVLSRAFYSRQNTVIPVLVNLCAMVINIFLVYTLGKQYGVAGMALGFSCAIMFNAVVLLLGLRIKLARDIASELLETFDRKLLLVIIKTLCAGGAMLAVTELLTNTISNLFATGWISLVIELVIVGGLGLLSYFVVARLVRLENARAMFRRS